MILFKKEDEENKTQSVTRTRRSDAADTSVRTKPPQARRKTKKAKNFQSNINILEGLEEDVIEMEEEYGDESRHRQEKENNTIDNSQTDLINNNYDNFLKSAPTENFYLELEKKFAKQKKEIYEKKEQERLRQQFDVQLKQKQKEDLKYQISTPHTALNAHKFLRMLALCVHGINVGFQFWNVIIIYLLDITKFTPNQAQQFNPFMILYDQLIMPVQCLSYFFLTICIIDSMDR